MHVLDFGKNDDILREFADKERKLYISSQTLRTVQCDAWYDGGTQRNMAASTERAMRYIFQLFALGYGLERSWLYYIKRYLGDVALPVFQEVPPAAITADLSKLVLFCQQTFALIFVDPVDKIRDMSVKAQQPKPMPRKMKERLFLDVVAEEFNKVFADVCQENDMMEKFVPFVMPPVLKGLQRLEILQFFEYPEHGREKVMKKANANQAPVLIQTGLVEEVQMSAYTKPLFCFEQIRARLKGMPKQGEPSTEDSTYLKMLKDALIAATSDGPNLLAFLMDMTGVSENTTQSERPAEAVTYLPRMEAEPCDHVYQEADRRSGDAGRPSQQVEPEKTHFCGSLSTMDVADEVDDPEQHRKTSQNGNDFNMEASNQQVSARCLRCGMEKRLEPDSYEDGCAVFDLANHATTMVTTPDGQSAIALVVPDDCCVCESYPRADSVVDVSLPFFTAAPAAEREQAVSAEMITPAPKTVRNQRNEKVTRDAATAPGCSFLNTVRPLVERLQHSSDGAKETIFEEASRLVDSVVSFMQTGKIANELFVKSLHVPVGKTENFLCNLVFNTLAKKAKFRSLTCYLKLAAEETDLSKSSKTDGIRPASVDVPTLANRLAWQTSMFRRMNTCLLSACEGDICDQKQVADMGKQLLCIVNELDCL